MALEDEVERLKAKVERLETRVAERAPVRRAAWWPWALGALVVVAVAFVVSRRTETPRPARALADAPDVSLTSSPSNAGWIIMFQARGPVREVFYQLPADPDFKSLGESNVVDPSTGLPMPKTYVMIPEAKLRERTMIRVKLADADTVRGPFDLVFDPLAQAVRFARSTLADVPQWVAFRKYNGELVAYFTTLLVYKMAFDDIRFGIDVDTPDQHLRFEHPEGFVMRIDDGDEIFRKVPPGTQAVVVEVVYRDGTRSPVQRFVVAENMIP